LTAKKLADPKKKPWWNDMSYTLLQLVDQVSGELGLTQPAAVIGSSNNQTIQLWPWLNGWAKIWSGITNGSAWCRLTFGKPKMR
jgi:hypothetical protein